MQSVQATAIFRCDSVAQYGVRPVVVGQMPAVTTCNQCSGHEFLAMLMQLQLVFFFCGKRTPEH